MCNWKEWDSRKEYPNLVSQPSGVNSTVLSYDKLLDMSGLEFVQFLSEKCHFFPSMLIVDVDNLGEVWRSRDQSFPVVAAHFSQLNMIHIVREPWESSGCESPTSEADNVDSLEISSNVSGKVLLEVDCKVVAEAIEPNDMLRFILEALFLRTKKRSQSSLHTLILTLPGHADQMRVAFDHLADFLSAQSNAEANYAQPDSLITSHCGLKHLSVHIGDVHELHAQPTADLKRIIEHQTLLQHLEVRLWYKVPVSITDLNQRTCACNGMHEYDQLMETICLLFRRAEFRALCFQGDLVHSTLDLLFVFRRMLCEFLSSPVQGQELYLMECLDPVLLMKSSYHDLPDFSQYNSANCPSNVVGSKVLRIQMFEDYCFLSVSASALKFTQCLSQCLAQTPSQCLAALSLENLWLGIDDYVLSTIASLKQLKSLRLAGAVRSRFMHVSMYHSSATVPTSEVDLCNMWQGIARLFSMPKLTALTLQVYPFVPPGCDSAHNNYWSMFAEHLIVGLQRQASIGQLTILDLSRNCLGQLKMEILGDLFDAIFSLPQLTSMTLRLRDNFFAISKWRVVYHSWTRSAGNSRLAQLEYTHISDGNSLYDIVPKLAVDIVPKLLVSVS